MYLLGLFNRCCRSTVWDTTGLHLMRPWKHLTKLFHTNSTIEGQKVSLFVSPDGESRQPLITEYWYLWKMIFINNSQHTFFDIQVFNPLASSNRASSINSVYQKHEREKRCGYDQWVRESENGSFSPLVFNTLGGMGLTVQVVYKRLADMIADKLNKSYSTIIRLVRWRLCFSLLRSTITCLRGPDTQKANKKGRFSILDFVFELCHDLLMYM